MLASGVRFGLRRSLPHLAGISLGFGFMLVVVGLGLHAVLHDYPIVLDILRYVGSAYLLWLAYQLATAPPPSAATTDTARPMGFWAAAAFQWVNPKAWVMAMTAMTTYLPENAQSWHVLLVVRTDQRALRGRLGQFWQGHAHLFARPLALPHFQHHHGIGVGGVALPYASGLTQHAPPSEEKAP
jgi:threonine/homoserine/homoserine lactone efflux protein